MGSIRGGVRTSDAALEAHPNAARGEPFFLGCKASWRSESGYGSTSKENRLNLTPGGEGGVVAAAGKEHCVLGWCVVRDSKTSLVEASQSATAGHTK